MQTYSYLKVLFLPSFLIKGRKPLRAMNIMTDCWMWIVTVIVGRRCGDERKRKKKKKKNMIKEWHLFCIQIPFVAYDVIRWGIRSPLEILGRHLLLPGFHACLLMQNEEIRLKEENYVPKINHGERIRFK